MNSKHGGTGQNWPVLSLSLYPLRKLTGKIF
jgi:hypothetical protein